MSDMVEKVARAVCIALGHEPEEWAYSERVRERCRRIARAAMQAMREPTKAMLQAGRLNDSEDGASGNPESIWQAMVNAALKGEAE